MPLISIGLPVYNGERFIAEAIESIIAQTFDDWEMIISDNASTDKTEQICRDYASRDSRIQYSRLASNQGAHVNFNRVFALSSGTYFKWASHDDRCHPSLLEKAETVLRNNPDVVVCTSRLIWIDENGQELGEFGNKLSNIDSPLPSVRFRQYSSLSHGCFDVFGIVRSEVMARTPRLANYVGSDRALLAELALYGKFYRIPEILFYSRDHSERSIRAMKFHQRGEWWDPNLRGVRVMPWWRLLREYACSISRAPIPGSQKLLCWASLVLWSRRNWRYLLSDLVPSTAPHQPVRPTVTQQPTATAASAKTTALPVSQV